MNNPMDCAAFRDYALALIDAAVIEKLPEGVIAEALVPKGLAASAHLMPALIDLTRLPGKHLDAVVGTIGMACEKNEPPSIAFLIKTTTSAAQFARHWNGMQLVEPQPKRKLWLRLHDPRVVHQMLRFFHPMQRRNLFGPAQAFTYWIGGEWITALRDIGNEATSPAAKNDIAAYAGPARWDWSRIERIGLVNRALHGAGVTRGAMLISEGASAEKLIERAGSRYGLVSQADLVEFAVRGLTAHAAFDEHPAISNVIKPDLTSSESSLSDRLALIEEPVWNGLRQK